MEKDRGSAMKSTKKVHKDVLPIETLSHILHAYDNKINAQKKAKLVLRVYF